MNAKYNEEVLCGWANENEDNQDSIHLANILQRKSTVQPLPNLKYARNKVQTQHRKQIPNIKFAYKEAFHRQSHHILKIKRQKTEGYDEQEDLSPSFKNENIIKAIRLEEPRVTLSPYLTDSHLEVKELRQANMTQYEARASSNPYNKKNRQSQTTAFSNTLQNKITPIKSHQFIPQVINQNISSKKNDSRHYVKLSTLEIVNDLRKQFRNDFLYKFGNKSCMSEQRDQKNEKNSPQIVKKVSQIHQKINQRFKQTFFQQDIFTKRARRSKLQAKYEANYPIILPQNLSIDKQSLQTKIQTLRSPQKGRIIFK